MTFFDIINYIFYKRNTLNHTLNDTDIQQFAPYMISRWLSFYSPTQCIFVNNTLNKFSGIDDKKIAIFDLFCNLIPQLKYKKILYIKKSKDKDLEDIDSVALTIAKNNYVSSREIKMYMALLA